MSVNNKLIDIEKLSRYHENLKEVLNTKEATAAADATSKANAAETAAKTYADGLVKDAEGNVKFDEAGAAAEAFDAAKDYADDLVKNEDGSVKFDDKGAAAAAQTAAAADATTKANAAQAAAEATAAADATSKANAAQAAAEATAAGLNAAMDERVVKLEAIDHDQIVADAIAAVVAGAESDFDTLKEVADWINSDTTGAAALQIKVAENADAITDLTNDKQDNITDLETIRTGAAAGAVAEKNAKDYAKDYADGLATNYDASGSAATAEQNAKDFATGLVMDGDKARFDAAGSAETAAAQALADAKSDAAGLYQVKGDYLIPSDLTFATDGDIDGLFA